MKWVGRKRKGFLPGALLPKENEETRKMREAIIESVQVRKKGKERVAKVTLAFQVNSRQDSDFVAFLVQKQSDIVRFSIEEEGE